MVVSTFSIKFGSFGNLTDLNRFGMGVRKGGSGEGSVGPGQYEPVERKEGGAKFSIESRGIDR